MSQDFVLTTAPRLNWFY